MREKLSAEPEDANIPIRKRLSWRPDLSDILRVVQAHFNVPGSTFVEKRRHGNDPRLAAVYLVRRLTACSVAVIADRFGKLSLSAISISVKRSEVRRTEDEQWDRLLAKLEKQALKKISKT